MVKIVVGNITSNIVGHMPPEVQEDLKKRLSYKVANARHMPKVKSGQWDGVIRLYWKHKGQSFYTGLMALVREVLQKHQIPFVFMDQRKRPDVNMPELKFIPPTKYTERDYQQFTLDRMMQFTRGIGGVATGGGKTMIVTEAISRIQTYPFLFFVLTKDLMEQAHEVLSTSLNTPIGMIGDGKCDMQKVTVCTVQTAIMALNAKNSKFKIDDYVFDDEDSWDEKGIASAEKSEKIRKLIRLTNGLYFDETHHAAAKTCKEVLTSAVNAYWRFGGSATPYRESGDGIMIQAMFGSKIVDISASYLIKNKWLVKPYIFMEPIKANGDWKSYAKVYEHSIVKNDVFNQHVAETAKHLVSRGKSTLILVQQYPQGDYLKELIPNCAFVSGRMTSKQRRDAINDLRQKKAMAMIATTLADEGLDIPTLDAALLAGGGASATRVNQRVGRTLRKETGSDKDKSIVVMYEHDAKYLEKHAKKVRTILRKEKEFEVLSSKGPDFINDEIDSTLGIKNDKPSMLDL